MIFHYFYDCQKDDSEATNCQHLVYLVEQVGNACVSI